MYTTEYSVTTAHADRFGRCKPSSLLRFAQDAAGEHCELLGTDRESMAEKNIFWAVIRQKMAITRLPRTGERVIVKTWPMPTTRVAYPRATEGYDKEGNLLFQVISIWVIMDMTSRAMVLPGKSGVEVLGTVVGGEPDMPKGLPVTEQAQTVYKTVEQQHLDRNGHMNNTRYLDWLCDLLPSEFHREHPMKAVTICYMSEALEGQQLQLTWTGTQLFRLDGSAAQTDVSGGHTRIFSAEAEF